MSGQRRLAILALASDVYPCFSRMAWTTRSARRSALALLMTMQAWMTPRSQQIIPGTTKRRSPIHARA